MQAFLAQFGYVAVFAALIAGGVGIPIPEELVQLTAGALSHEQILDLRIAIPVVWSGIVAGDAVLFLLAQRHGGRLLETRAARRVLTPKRRASLERHFTRHALLTVAVARHTGGVRFPAFVLAATHGVPLAKFVLADGMSAMASVPLVVGAGYLFWQHIGEVRREIRIVELSILAAVAVAAVIVHLLRRRRRAAA